MIFHSFISGLMSILMLAAIVAAAPAPAIVTVYETSTTTYGASAATATPVNSVAAASTTASAASSSSNGGFLSGFISQFKLLLSAFNDDNSSGAAAVGSASASAASPAATATTSESNLDQFLNWLTGSASTLASATATPTGAASASFTPSTLTTSSVAPQQPASSSPKTSSTSTTSESSETSSSSDSDIYAGIYNSPDVDEDFAKSILDAHNKYRADHGVGELSWDVDAYNYAKNNADNYDCSGVLTHTHGKYGENLAAGFSTGTSALHAWYVEGESYDYTSANSYDHFTQVVWKGTTKVGCAYKDCSSNNWGKYVICEYDPAGNIIGYNKENVLPLVSGASASADY